LRLHPGEAGGRFKDHQFGRSVRVQIPNKRGNGKLDKFYPTTKENQEFVNTIAHADVVINLASTITLDAAICDRPVINIAYDLSPNLRYQARLNQYYTEYDHYQTVLQCGAVRLARSHEELLSHIKTYLLHPEFEREGRKKLVGLWCGPNDGRAGKRLATSILQLIAAQRDIAPHLAHSDL
jgi:CDP-glycerol glycerophosphotransferase (TagB/SpsB family)